MLVRIVKFRGVIPNRCYTRTFSNIYEDKEKAEEARYIRESEKKKLEEAKQRKNYFLEYEYVPNMIEKRTPHRPTHLKYCEPFVKNHFLLAGGALVPEVKKGLLLFSSNSKESVEDFAKNDPYVKAGLVVNFTVTEWAVVVGSL